MKSITQDLSLCAYLSLNDVEIDVKWSDNVCLFQYEQTDRTAELSERYLGGKASVEPKAFSRAHARVRGQMFSHPDSPKKNRGPR